MLSSAVKIRDKMQGRNCYYNTLFCRLLDVNLTRAARGRLDWPTMRKIEDATVINHIYLPYDYLRLCDDYYDTLHPPENNC